MSCPVGVTRAVKVAGLVCHERNKEDRCRRSDCIDAVLYRRWRGRLVGSVVLRGRPAGGGRKPPQAAAVKSRGGERCGNGAPLSASGVGQEGERERSADDVSKPLDDIETGSGGPARDEPGGSLLIGQVVSGMEVARAWPGLWCGTWEPVVPRSRAASGAVWACGRFVEARTSSGGNREGQSSDAGHRGGPSRGSCDAR